MTDAIKKEIKAFKEEAASLEQVEHAMDILFAWHKQKVAGLEHMLRIPQGIEVSFNNGEPLIMSEDIHKGFIIGVTLGLIELGTLPFVSPDEETSDEPSIH